MIATFEKIESTTIDGAEEVTTRFRNLDSFRYPRPRVQSKCKIVLRMLKLNRAANRVRYDKCFHFDAF